MELKDLKTFRTVYTENSINQAAKKLFITPQGLSRNIRLLENELGNVLFQRTKQGICPTESARLLMEKSEYLIRQFEEVKNAIRQQENRTVVLRIGCACGVFNLLPFPLLLQFIRENPDIRVEWCEYTNREVKERLLASKIEYGFVVGEWREPGILSRKLAQKDIFLLVYEGHPLYHRDEVSLEQLNGEELILMNEHFHMHRDFVEACRARGFEPSVAAKTADVSFQYKLCSQKVGLAVVPGFVQEEFRMEQMRAVPFRENLTWEVYSVYKENNKNYEVIQKLEYFLKDRM